jgi:hypothetical protein
MYIITLNKTDMKKILNRLSITTFLILTGMFVKAQTIDDFLLFSMHEYQGTARFSAMGGAFNALGADFTSLSTNPAGIGLFRSSEFSFTPTVSNSKITTDYLGVSENDARTRFGFANVGIVGANIWNTNKETGLLSFNLAAGYNKLMDYHKYAPMRGNNSSSSIIDSYMDIVSSFYMESDHSYIGDKRFIRETKDADLYVRDNFPIEQWTSVGAMKNYLLDYDDDAHITTGILADGDKVNQFRNVTQGGSNGEYVFSAGGNINNKLYFGLTVGCQDLHYDKIVSFTEQGVSGNVSSFVNNSSYEYYHTDGFGVNFKLGVIYKLLESIRAGIAFHTPTWFDIVSRYSFDMSSNIGSRTYNTSSPFEDKYNYRFQSPYRFEAGLAFLIGKVGLISADYEFVGYKSMRVADEWGSEWTRIMRDNIRNEYRNASNFRAGAEVYLGLGMMIRGGFNYYQSPYAVNGEGFERYAYSGGIGYRGKSFFTDFAYVLNTGKYYYTPYTSTSNAATTAVEKEDRGRFMLTIGFKF